MVKKVKDKGATKRLIGHADFAKALGAQETDVEINTQLDPFSLSSLRQFLAGRLRSTGGRPRLEGTLKKRNKVPFFSEDWEILEMISKYYGEKEGLRVSSGQIASALIHTFISKIDTSSMKLKPCGATFKKDKDDKYLIAK
jgi:hypothetical protein